MCEQLMHEDLNDLDTSQEYEDDKKNKSAYNIQDGLSDGDQSPDN